MHRKVFAVLAAFGVLAQDAAFARQAARTNLSSTPTNSKQIEIAWEELAPLVVEQKISTMLPEGVKLQGEVLAVRPDSLVLDVHKSSQKKVYPRGQTEIPRPLISELKIIRERNAVMRIVGGILGAIGGLCAVGALGVVTESVAVVVPALILGLPLSAAGGYYAGKLADRYTTRIVIRSASAAGDSGPSVNDYDEE